MSAVAAAPRDALLVQWDQNERGLADVQSVDALLDTLERKLRSTQPTIVSVVRSDTQEMLSIALGRRTTVLNHIPGNGKPPYFCSLGDVAKDGVIVFFLDGHWTELLRRHEIPLRTGRAAMREFCANGGLPRCVLWEEV